MENNKGNNGDFQIIVNSSGNFIARDITFTGPVNIGCGNNAGFEYSDEQIAKAIRAINGKKKPLNSKRRWAAVYWCLRCYCNFPSNVRDFCEKVEKLPLGLLEFECDYDSIRHFCTLSFMSEDCRHIDNLKVSKTNYDFFLQCKEVVLALVRELEKSALPTIET